MVNKEFLEKLFQKHKLKTQEEIEKVWKVLEEVQEQEEAEKAISKFSDKIDLARQIIESKGIIKGKNNEAIPVTPVLPLYYDKSGLWWRWNHGKYKWEMIDEVDLMNHISWSSPANTVNAKERSEILQALKQVSRENKPIKPKSTVLQFSDQVIDLETGEKRKATWQEFFTNPIPHKLSRKHETPTIDKIFAEWVGKENVLLLKEIMAYSMIPNYPLHRIFCFIGSGMNGKSKFLELLRRFVGEENCCSTELDTLLNSRFEVSRLHKKLVCQMGETNFSEMNKTSMLKKLSGGDLIGFEYKNKNPFEEINYAKIIIATNNLPATTDKTIGFYRRWVIIDFPNQFTEKKDVLSEIPEEEYSQLATQLVGVLMDLLKKREFHNEGTVEERMERYESRSNFLEKFIKLFVKENFDGYITKADFYKKFTAWCKENRHRGMAENSLGLSMKKLGIETGKRTFNWMNDGRGGQARTWEAISWKE